jgi:ribosomal protein S18 acetylase RimI-like enzyme
MTADYADLIAQGTVSVLLEGGELRGVLVLKQEEAMLWIENVAVHPGHHHRGFGRRLLAYAEQRARVAHLLEVRLYTNERMVENMSLYRRLGYQEVERRAEAGFRRVFMRKVLDSTATCDSSIALFEAPDEDSAPAVSDLELLRIEIETLWATDDRGRIDGRELVIGSSALGNTVAVGNAVADDLAAVLVAAVDAAPPPHDITLPPTVLEQCRQLLADTLGPVELTRSSGPSYLIPETISFEATVALVRSDAGEVESLRAANPGNWEPDEWAHLLEGRLGPWVMAVRDSQVISICHTARRRARGAEAGVWTRPEFRGQGHAAAVTAAWAALMRPTGRHLFYSVARTNVSSQRVAARLGLRPIGWLWQLAAPGS